MSPTKQAKPMATKVDKDDGPGRNQNSIKWQNGEKKNILRTQAKSGGQSSGQ